MITLWKKLFLFNLPFQKCMTGTSLKSLPASCGGGRSNSDLFLTKAGGGSAHRSSAHQLAVRASVILPRLCSLHDRPPELCCPSASTSTFANHPPPHPSPSPLSFSPSPILRLSIASTTEQQEGGDGEGMSGAWGGTTQKCASCGRTVYPVEELAADGRVYHRPCFRCHHCKSTLQVPSLSSTPSFPPSVPLLAHGLSCGVVE